MDLIYFNYDTPQTNSELTLFNSLFDCYLNRHYRSAVFLNNYSKAKTVGDHDEDRRTDYC